MAGSQPLTAENPAPEITPLHPVILPVVISVNADLAELYSHGLRNPRPAFPAATRLELMSWITELKVGVAQEVPSTSSAEPEATITTGQSISKKIIKIRKGL